MYYRVLPTIQGNFEIQFWRWYWPFWSYLTLVASEEKAADWIKAHSTYYDGADNDPR